MMLMTNIFGDSVGDGDGDGDGDSIGGDGDRRQPEKAGQEQFPVMASPRLICPKTEESRHKDSGNTKFWETLRREITPKILEVMKYCFSKQSSDKEELEPPVCVLCVVLLAAKVDLRHLEAILSLRSTLSLHVS